MAAQLYIGDVHIKTPSKVTVTEQTTHSDATNRKKANHKMSGKAVRIVKRIDCEWAIMTRSQFHNLKQKTKTGTIGKGNSMFFPVSWEWGEWTLDGTYYADDLKYSMSHDNKYAEDISISLIQK